MGRDDGGSEEVSNRYGISVIGGVTYRRRGILECELGFLSIEVEVL